MWVLDVETRDTLRGDAIYIYSSSCELSDFSSKDGSMHGGNEWVERHGIEASSS
jgi:hypothetical protein